MTNRRLAAGALAIAALLAGGAAMAQTTGTTLNVSANVLSKNNCRFTISTPSTLAFGFINPTSASNATASVAWQFRCGGSDSTVVYQLTASNGSNYSGGTRRMRMGLTANYLPYSLAITPSTGTAAKNAFVPFTIDGIVAPADFIAVVAGAYSDTVTITLSP